MDYKEAEMVLDGFYNSPYTSDIAKAGRVIRDVLNKRIAELQSECETATALVMSHESTIEGLHNRIAELEEDLKAAYSHIAEVDSNIGDEYYKNHQLEEENEQLQNELTMERLANTALQGRIDEIETALSGSYSINKIMIKTEGD